MTSLKNEDAAVAQSVERRIGSAEVTGPIPVSSSLKVPCLRDFFVSGNRKEIRHTFDCKSETKEYRRGNPKHMACFR